ncbi:hypothetical protein QJS66_19360 [Kocuria rhizophila]|nr:hypothetical protein QJS66_19360 [Kocuria rhizophila]
MITTVPSMLWPCTCSVPGSGPAGSSCSPCSPRRRPPPPPATPKRARTVLERFGPGRVALSWWLSGSHQHRLPDRWLEWAGLRLRGAVIAKTIATVALACWVPGPPGDHRRHRR